MLETRCVDESKSIFFIFYLQDRMIWMSKNSSYIGEEHLDRKHLNGCTWTGCTWTGNTCTGKIRWDFLCKQRRLTLAGTDRKWYVIWHLICHSTWNSICNFIWHLICHLIWNLIWDLICHLIYCILHTMYAIYSI